MAGPQALLSPQVRRSPGIGTQRKCMYRWKIEHTERILLMPILRGFLRHFGELKRDAMFPKFAAINIPNVQRSYVFGVVLAFTMCMTIAH